VVKSLTALLLATLSLRLHAAPPGPSAAAHAVTLKTHDGVTVHGQFYEAPQPKALILLFHQARSSAAEYATIAPRLVKLGYSALAIDQRSGGAMYGANATAQGYGREAGYLDTEPDLEAALAWAGQRGLPVIVWGSSYSAALVFRLAARHPREIAAILAFSPGEYLGQPELVRQAAATVSVPVFITSGIEEEERAKAKLIHDAVKAPGSVLAVPKTAGIHGSSTLRSDRNALGAEENWQAVAHFLQSLPL
jgi:alpha-beta hydrolase superfamily lysophospholipase